MSITSQGEGWWLASDGRWYPPGPPAQLAAAAQTPGGPAVGHDTASTSWPSPPRLYTLQIGSVISFILFSFRQSKRKTGTIDEMEAFYRQVLVANLALGWWSIFGLIWTPMALSANRGAMEKIRVLASAGATAPGWRPDPSGRHAARYWDGRAWTSQVQSIATDPIL